jgi:phosphoglucosamine mutase
MSGVDSGEILGVVPREVKCGTDGIRGVANVEITNQVAGNFGAAMVDTISSEFMFVGHDTRESGEELSGAVINTALRKGINVIDLGVAPTPMLAFLSKKYGAASTVVTASHNPYKDNGLKGFNTEGSKLSDEQNSNINDIVNNRKIVPDAAQPGTLFSKEAWAARFEEEYVDYLVGSVDDDLLEGMSIVVDGSYGASHNIIKNVIGKLGANVITLNDDEPNGQNINDGVGAEHPAAAAAKLLETGADMAVILDGDSDRITMVDKEGNAVDGDQLIYILAMNLKQQGLLTNDTVVVTIMSNEGLIEAFARQGIVTCRSDVGDKKVAEMMVETGAVVGGEKSGHLIIDRGDNARTGDGLLAALKVIEVTKRSGRNLNDMAADVTLFPQELVKSYPSIGVEAALEHDTYSTELAKMNELMQGAGRILIRGSGTEKGLARVMVEHKDAETAKYVVGYMQAVLNSL